MAGKSVSGNLRVLKNVRVPFFKVRDPQKQGFKNGPLCPVPICQKPAKNVFEQIQIWEQLLTSKSPLSAIHKIIWHMWEPRSREVNNDEINLRIYHGNF